ncbi:unnamed protein product [Prorocentrum cordatum]|uniref:Protein-serine/threonine phosphatase n=1 Tax=Prorocentrum cordatum TaxID=2364126 RepID=A0ABN9UID8_9DINO|nr:unnamed protein product [Polarella glacialis]
MPGDWLLVASGGVWDAFSSVEVVRRLCKSQAQDELGSRLATFLTQCVAQPSAIGNLTIAAVELGAAPHRLAPVLSVMPFGYAVAADRETLAQYGAFCRRFGRLLEKQSRAGRSVVSMSAVALPEGPAAFALRLAPPPPPQGAVRLPLQLPLEESGTGSVANTREALVVRSVTDDGGERAPLLGCGAAAGLLLCCGGRPTAPAALGHMRWRQPPMPLFHGGFSLRLLASPRDVLRAPRVRGDLPAPLSDSAGHSSAHDLPRSLGVPSDLADVADSQHTEREAQSPFSPLVDFRWLSAQGEYLKELQAATPRAFQRAARLGRARQVLGVAEGAHRDAIEGSFRRLSVPCRPDKAPAGLTAAEAVQRWKDLRDAKSLLLKAAAHQSASAVLAPPQASQPSSILPPLGLASLDEGAGSAEVAAGDVRGACAEAPQRTLHLALECLLMALEQGASSAEVAAGDVMGACAEAPQTTLNRALERLILALRQGASFAKVAAGDVMGACAEAPQTTLNLVLECILLALQQGGFDEDLYASMASSMRAVGEPPELLGGLLACACFAAFGGGRAGSQRAAEEFASACAGMAVNRPTREAGASVLDSLQALEAAPAAPDRLDLGFAKAAGVSPESLCMHLHVWRALQMPRYKGSTASPRRGAPWSSRCCAGPRPADTRRRRRARGLWSCAARR